MSDEKIFKLILLVEDEPAHAMLIKRVLLKHADAVHVSESVKEAKDFLGSASPELIITDLNLPDSRGVEHVQVLLSMGQGVPVMMLTSSNSLDDAVKAMRLGASDFIVKNFDSTFEEIFGLALRRLYKSEEIRREKRKVEREMEALRRAIENGQDGMAVVNSKGEFSYQNSAFQALISLTNGKEGNLFDAIGESVKSQKKLHADLKDKLNSLGKGAVWSTEISVEGVQDCAFDLNLSVIEGEGASQTRSVVWMRDVSDRKRRERFQKEILSTTTHDLKGPLGAISLCADMLQDMDVTPEKAQQIILRIASSSKGALGMIEEFLSARRIQEGTFVLQPSQQDVALLIRSVVEEYQAVAQSKEIVLTASFKEDKLDACVDALALTRVIGNLVSNALKFTPSKGKVMVDASTIEGTLVVSVSDSGAGMEPIDVQGIFERFGRLNKHAGIQGTGLGLYVVKNIVSAHGGSIEVTSQLGQGSMFIVTFPANPPVNEKGQILCLDFA